MSCSWFACPWPPIYHYNIIHTHPVQDFIQLFGGGLPLNISLEESTITSQLSGGNEISPDKIYPKAILILWYAIYVHPLTFHISQSNFCYWMKPCHGQWFAHTHTHTHTHTHSHSRHYSQGWHHHYNSNVWEKQGTGKSWWIKWNCHWTSQWLCGMHGSNSYQSFVCVFITSNLYVV